MKKNADLYSNYVARGRILIVDDDDISRILLQSILGESYDIQGVSNGEQAIELLRNQPCDLVLLDIMMAGMDGYTVLQKIRTELRLMDLPVIFLSALDQPEDVVRGLQLGANDYVTSPLEPAVLRARIATQIKLKRLSDEHKHQIQILERAENLRVQLSRIASHDLKNPLHNIRIAHSLLKEEASDPRFMRLLETIGLSVETMQHVIENFVDLVAIQTDTLKFRREVITVRDLVMNVVTQYEIAAGNKGIALEVDSIPGQIIADRARMIQIFSNLVSNAIKYSPQQSTVRIWSEDRDEENYLYVGDQGPGIPEAERHLLFQEFSRLSPRPTAGEASTGLGLWIVRHLVRGQGGNVGAYFPDEGGSVFWVQMPAVYGS
jgi:two-component system, sensor histidine kinase and response regulator